MELANVVKDELIPASDEILKCIRKMDNGMDIVYDPVEFDNPFETIAEYAAELSPEISDAANKLLEIITVCLLPSMSSGTIMLRHTTIFRHTLLRQIST